MANNDGRSEVEKLYDDDSGIKKAKNGFNKAFGMLGGILGKGLKSIIGKIMVALGAYAWPAIIVIVVIAILIFLFIGIASFILMGPAGVTGQFVKFADNLFTKLTGFVIGQDVAQVDKKDVIEIASYLDNMGYKLEGYGFAEKENIERDDKGEITDVDSPYLVSYLAAENKTYMIANQNFNLRDYFKDTYGSIALTGIGLAKTAISGEDGSWGSGMIVINRKLWDESPSNENVKVDRKKKTLEVKMKSDKKDSEEVTYQYNLDGWMGRYGKPIEFLLALHIGTMAPDFAYEVATGDNFDTKVYIKFKLVGTKVKLRYKGRYVISYTDEKGVYYEGWDKSVREYAAKVKSGKIEYNNKLKIYNSNVPAEYRQPILTDQEIQEETDEECRKNMGLAESDIDAAKKYEDDENKFIYKPYIRAVNNHWFRDLDFKDSYKVGNTKDINGTVTLGSVTFQTEGQTTGDIFQVAEPKIVGKPISKLILEELVNGDDISIIDPVTKAEAAPQTSDANKNKEKTQEEKEKEQKGKEEQEKQKNQVSIAAGMETAKQPPPVGLNGARMDNGKLGCAEAVTKILAYTFEDFAQMVREGVCNCDVLLERCKALGIEVIPFDMSRVAQGDIISYNNSLGTNGHVMVADHQENGVWYVFGNSGNTETARVGIHRLDYMETNVIIKVSNYKGAGTSASTAALLNQTTGNEYEGYRLDELFRNKYRIADGESGLSEEEQPVKIRNTMRYALAMLESVDNFDSQYILRDLKRYLEKRGFTFNNQYIITNPEKWNKYEKDDRNLEYNGSRYITDGTNMNGKTSTNGTTKKNYKLGSIFRHPMTGAEIKSDEKKVILHHKGEGNSDGFETGEDVISPGASYYDKKTNKEIVIVKGDTVEIKLSTSGVVEYTIIIKGFNPTISTGTKVSKGTKLGTTRDNDIEITMKDANGNPVNPADYLPFVVAVNASDEDIMAMARCIAGEDNTSEEGMAAVAWCILNRVNDAAYPNTIKGVIEQTGQFAGKNGTATTDTIRVAKNCIAGVTSDPLKGRLKNGPALGFRTHGGDDPDNYFNSAHEDRTQALANQGLVAVCGGNVYFHKESDF